MLILAAVLGLMTLTTAAVQAGGAAVDQNSEWYDEEASECTFYPAFISCFERWRAGHRVTHSVLTPSGNTKSQFHDDYTYTYHYWRIDRITDEIVYEYSSSSEGKLHDHQLWKAGEEHVFHINDHTEFETDLETCTDKWTIHIVDGQWRTDRWDLDCEPK